MNGAGPLQFPLYTSYSKTLKQTSIRHYHHPPAMKDRPPPSSYGAVYVPPHHRLRSLITSSAPSNHSSSAPFVVDSKTVTTHYNNNNNNSFPRGNPYPYLPYHQHQHQQQHRHQLKKISHFDAAADDFSEEGSDFDIDPPSNPGAPTSDNVDGWKWKLTKLLHSKHKQELVSRDKKDRRDFEQIASLASKMGLYSNLYVKVVVVSKLPLPNYRFDLDDRRPQREVVLPPSLQRRVDCYLEDHLSQKSGSMESIRDNAFSRSNSSCSIATDEGLFEQPDPLPQSKAVMEKIIWRRSMQMRSQQQAWQESREGRKMMKFRQSLPAYKEKDALLMAISQNQVVIVSGETGCGKTTQIPQFILESEIESVHGALCSIICTQPRRISAMSVSERVAAERGEKLGETVGYKVRLEGMKGKDTHLLFCTTGILLRRLLVDRNLKGVTHVIVDEIHERGMNEDFLLIVLKDLLARQPELRLILMSATLDAELFSSYFGGAPMVHIPAKTQSWSSLAMASTSLTQFLSLPRWHSKWPFFPSSSVVQLHDPLSHKRWGLMAISRKKVKESLAQELSGEEGIVVEKKISRASKRPPARSRKKVIEDSPEDDFLSVVNADVTDEEINKPPASGEDSKKTQRRTRRKAESTSSVLGEEKVEKKITRRGRIKKKVDDTENEVSEMELSDREGDSFIVNVEDEYDEDLELGKDGDEEVSFTYGWPPLVCCFGATQHAFVPSGRPANRLIDYELQERMKDALWTPEKFVRAPGGCASNVAVALATLGGKVALMGKIGDDDYGQSLLYYLNVNNVQTRSMRIDSKRATAASQMKIGKRGGLKMTCVKPCAEDSLSRSEINIDVLKEAKMFYFNTFSMLDRNMRSTMLRAIKISKKLGGIIFYDLNLPLPLWQSCEETKMFIQEVWNLADVIEVTKQELEFLCGIKPSENFDTRDNDRSKFIHYTPEVFGQLWHENLKVLFVTNGTSKIHYYTKEHNSAVLGMEDAPITPFTGDMSASGDGIVAALMRMLTVQPHLITDKGYLEQSVKYAVNCGVIDQWRLARTVGFPPKEGMEENVEPDPNGIRSITEREYRTLQPEPVS